ncbi:hypothetical protein HHK36_000836 [Tetracentron sinense]|uniref:Cytochrome P450 n=1 Tax=Tetracentron sinense TaxID=13715 RepID=A0A835DU80_TETSI|nr:hypothetical protein HHK36_000836 [Tetracentron sinense]
MESWFFILIFSLSICALLKSLFNLLHYNPQNTRKLPPGPTTIPILSNFLWLRKSFSDLEPILRNLRLKYGPVVSLHIGSKPAIFVTTHELAHHALIQNGAIFADRPPALEVGRIMTSNQHNISSASYGPLWRLLRRNLMSEILHPSRVKSYSRARKWVLEILTNKLRSKAESGDAVRVVDHFQYAMFCLLVLMCFGEKVDEKIVREVEAVQRAAIVNIRRFNILNFLPRLGKILFRKRWDELLELRRNQEEVLVPLIRARQELRKVKQNQEEEFIISYADTLFNLQLPDGGRKLNEKEMVSLCSEFLSAGTDTTSTALQWIMANLVKHQDIQAKLFSEINGVVGSGGEIKEEDLQNMPYLKAVVLEALRRHPPGHFVLPHAVTEDFPLNGYVVPKNSTVNFMVAEMGWDPKVWEDPMEFKPERFLSMDGGEVFDVTGSREIKMMPFGAGRRICPGFGLAMLHLEYFLANLVREFEWTAGDGDDVDLSEKLEFTVVMKNPLQAHIKPRLSIPMESWFFILIFSLSICALLKYLFNLLRYNPKETRKLPPGPTTIPILSNFLWLRKSFSDLEPILRNLRLKYGPVVTLHIGSKPAIFVTTHELAHHALIQNGAIFADRPPSLEAGRIMNSNQHNISSASYGPLWRLLRRNLTSEILHPSRVKSYSRARKWVLEILINKLRSEAESGDAVCVVDHFQYAMFCLLVLMCFGEKLDEKIIREIEAVQRAAIVNFSKFNILNFLPRLGKILFRKRWNELLELRRNQDEVLVPLIRARQELRKVKRDQEEEFIISYADTLFNLQLPDEGRKLNEKEMVSLCSEFLSAGTDTTSTALQWIMANLVKHQDIQAKLFSEINGVVGSGGEIKEEDLQNMPYLKAVVLEALRRHPPGHFVLPHAVTEDFPLNGYVVPKNGTVNFMVAEMGWDPKVWEDPMEFKPERFFSMDGGEVFDVTGSREIKMMPFGAGRRICPGFGLAMLHLEYFLANLVREFEWTAGDGDDVDLSEKLEFTVVMKNPLRAHIKPRFK